MSVHKSKGLEFPVVIFANASKGTDKGDRSGRIKIHRDHGIGLPVVNREQHWHRSSILQKMILNSAKDEMIEEEIRILYVALTRAKDGLEIVGTVKDLQKLEQEISTKSFLEMLYLPLMEKGETELVTYTDAEDLEQCHQTRMHTADQLRQKVQELNNAELEALTDARLSYEYPHQSEEEIKPKYSVTELNRGATETPRPVTIEAFNLEDVSAAAGAAAGGAAGGAVDSGTGAGAGGAGRALTAAQRGTVMHLLMEKVDFAKAASGGRDYMQSVADILLADDAITTEEYDSLDIDNAAAFFETELGQRAAEAAAEGRLRKEKEFIFKMEMAEDASTIVQGVIDCFFGEDDGIVLIDYKNSYMGAGRTADDIKETYAAQIDLYSQALEGATGRNVKEAYLFLFDTGQFVRM